MTRNGPSMNAHAAWRSWPTASLADASLALAPGSVTSANVAVERLVVVCRQGDGERRAPRD
jgi:hypothetical protein